VDRKKLLPVADTKSVFKNEYVLTRNTMSTSAKSFALKYFFGRVLKARVSCTKGIILFDRR